MQPSAEGQFMMEKIAQLILKSLYRADNTLSGTWFCDLLTDW